MWGLDLEESRESEDFPPASLFPGGARRRPLRLMCEAVRKESEEREASREDAAVRLL